MQTWTSWNKNFRNIISSVWRVEIVTNTLHLIRVIFLVMIRPVKGRKILSCHRWAYPLENSCAVKRQRESTRMTRWNEKGNIFTVRSPSALINSFTSLAAWKSHWSTRKYSETNTQKGSIMNINCGRGEWYNIRTNMYPWLFTYLC